MYRQSFLSVAAVAALAIGMVSVATTADAQERVQWKMHSAWSSSVPHLGTNAVRFTENVARLSDGKFTLKFFEPGALIQIGRASCRERV